MKLRLIYPDLPFWRAETSRLALFIGGIEFEDVRPSREEIPKMRTDGTFPFGQFPVLQVDGKTIAKYIVGGGGVSKVRSLNTLAAIEALIDLNVKKLENIIRNMIQNKNVFKVKSIHNL